MITNTKNFMMLLGFQENDLVSWGASAPDWRFHRGIATAGELWQTNESAEADNYNMYYSISSFKGRGKATEDQVDKVFELVLDIDYGTHHKRAEFEDYAHAWQYIKEHFPKPTVIIHTGGGFQYCQPMIGNWNPSFDPGCRLKFAWPSYWLTYNH